jgi:transaldolase
VAYGLRYYAVCPERFIVKVPMTPAGFLAARALARQQVPINYTLGFSARQNYLAARFSRTAYVNVFMGRLNAFVIDNKLGDGEYVGEKATLASQQVLRRLGHGGQPVPRQIGASMRTGEQIYDLAGLDVFTMPVNAAREFRRAMETNPRPLKSQLEREFTVTLNPGVDARKVGLNGLWEVPAEVPELADALDAADVDAWTGEEFVAAAREHGAACLFPRWTEGDLAAVAEDGKIPHYERWASRLASGAVGLDALMSISALYSFVADQRQLDDRIRSVLADAGIS